ncbi:MAG: tetratricopeptide repeat protein [Leptolyngbya sp. BL-A-14]
MRYLSAGFASALLLVSPMSSVLLQGEVVQAQTIQDRKAAAPVLAQAVDQRKAEADRLLQQGDQQYYQTSQYEAALQSWEAALKLYRELNDRNGEAKALNGLGIAYGSLSQYDKAISYYQQALPLFQQVKNRNGEAKALVNLGIAYGSLSQYDKAVSYYQQALPLFQQVKNRGGQALALGNLGQLYLSKGQLDTAIAYYQQALPIFVQIKDFNDEAAVLLSMGNAYWLLSQYGKAIDHEQQALLIYQQIKDRNGEAKVLVSLGTVYQSLSQYEKAITLYQQALPTFQQVKDRYAEAVLLSNLGSAYQSLSQHDKAIAYKQQSLSIYQQFKNRNSEAGVLNDLGSIYQSLLQYDKAVTSYQQALSIFRQFKSSGEAVALTNLGNTYQSLLQYDKAIASYQQALPIFRQFKLRQSEAEVLTSLGSVFQKQEQSDVAIVLYKQSVNLRELIRKDIRKLPREAQEIYTSSAANTYRVLAALLLDQGRTREAQTILELLKVQEVRSYGTDQDTNSPTVKLPLHPIESQALQIFEQAIASQSLSLQTLMALGQPLIQNRDRIIQESNNTPSPIGNPQAILNANPNALVIQNLIVGDNLWVLWTNASGKTTATFVPNFTEAELNSTVQAFRKQLGTPSSNLETLKATSNKLYNWLIPPQLQAELAKNPKQHLIFSLDHVTRYIPVAVLFDGNQYLAQRYILSNLVTMDSDMSDRLSLNGKTPNVLALGTSKAFPPNFNALPNVPAELDSIVRNGNDKGIYPGKIRLNEAFTANSLRDNREPFRILHIATHGSFNPDSITESFLLLGDGTHLLITDIASLTNLNTIHLVVLSACETGLSNTGQDGTEISGISGYFLYRGAKAVLASLWQVNDASTSLLMKQFYQNLATGKMTKVEALQRAQLSLLENNRQSNLGSAVARTSVQWSSRQSTGAIARNLSHPYYWAPFILIGNGL